VVLVLLAPCLAIKRQKHVKALDLNPIHATVIEEVVVHGLEEPERHDLRPDDVSQMA
jgi:hypothetical protein